MKIVRLTWLKDATTELEVDTSALTQEQTAELEALATRNGFQVDGNSWTATDRNEAVLIFRNKARLIGILTHFEDEQ